MADILNLVSVLRRYLWLVILTTVIACVVAFYGTSLITPSYTAKALVRVLSINEGQISSPLFDTVYANQQLNTYAIVGRNQATLDDLASSLGLNQAPEIIIDVLSDTEILRITVKYEDPVVAALAANTLAELLVANSKELVSGQGPNYSELLGLELEQIEADLDAARANYADLVASDNAANFVAGGISGPEATESVAVSVAQQEVEFMERIYFQVLSQFQQVRSIELIRANTVSIVNEATVPRTPTSPDVRLNVLLGGFVGFLGSLALASIIDLMDTRLRSTKDIAAITDLPILATIPRLPRSGRPVAVNLFPHGEEFRRLRANLLSSLESKTLIVTSPEPREGRSLIAVNLALSLAQINKRVIILDCDLRTPPHKKSYANFCKGPTINQLLTGEVSIADNLENFATQQNCIIPADELAHNVSELLVSPRMTTLIRTLESIYDYVLIDTPAFLSAADATILSKKLKNDGLIVVVRKGKTSRDSLAWMLHELQAQNIGVVGMVVNFDKQVTRNRFTKYYSKTTFVTDSDDAKLLAAYAAEASQDNAQLEPVAGALPDDTEQDKHQVGVVNHHSDDTEHDRSQFELIAAEHLSEHVEDNVS